MGSIIFLIFGCKKDQPQATNQLVDISFSAKLVSRDTAGINVGDDCFSEQADLAVISLDNGNTYTTEVYYNGAVPYTKSIKLVPGSYHVNKFDLCKDIDHNGEVYAQIDGPPIATTPSDASTYHIFVTDGVPIELTVGAFEKIEVPVEVLCFEDLEVIIVIDP